MVFIFLLSSKTIKEKGASFALFQGRGRDVVKTTANTAFELWVKEHVLTPIKTIEGENAKHENVTSDILAVFGHVNILPTRAGGRSFASLLTPYFNASGKCLEMFYRPLGMERLQNLAYIKVIAIWEDLTEQELFSTRNSAQFDPRSGDIAVSLVKNLVLSFIFRKFCWHLYVLCTTIFCQGQVKDFSSFDNSLRWDLLVEEAQSPHQCCQLLLKTTEGAVGAKGA